jgi:hypothetical protein
VSIYAALVEAKAVEDALKPKPLDEGGVKVVK